MNSEQYTTCSEVQRQAQALVGRRVSNAQLGLGSILILEFRDHDGNIDAYLRSESAWLLAHAGVGVVGSFDDREAQEEAILALVNAEVRSLELGRLMQIAIAFSEEHEILLLPSYVASSEYENWVLRLPNGIAYTAGPGPRLFSGPANEP